MDGILVEIGSIEKLAEAIIWMTQQWQIKPLKCTALKNKSDSRTMEIFIRIIVK